MCVQLFTAFEEALLVSALKSNIWPPFPWKPTAGKFFFYFISIFFHTDHNKINIQWNDWVENEQNFLKQVEF